MSACVPPCVRSLELIAECMSHSIGDTMKTAVMILALALAACADLPEDQIDTGAEVELGNVTSELALPGPYAVVMAMTPPTGWRDTQQTLWYRRGIPSTTPVRYNPPQTIGMTGALTKDMPRGVSCPVGIVPGNHTVTCGGQIIPCPYGQRPSRLVAYYRDQNAASYVAGMVPNATLNAGTNNVNPSGAGGYSYRDASGFTYYGVQCNYSWYSNYGHEVQLRH